MTYKSYSPRSSFVLRLSSVVALFALVACTTPRTAADQVDQKSDLAITAQYEQYNNDAKATLDTRDATQAAIAIQIANTAQASTATAEAVRATTTALAAVAGTSTAQAEISATQLAYANATGTARAEVQMTEAAHAHATETQAAAAVATGTAVFVATQTQLTIEREQVAIQREQITSVVVIALCVIGVSGFIFVLIRYGNAAIAGKRKRDSVIATGPNGVNTLVVYEHNGAFSTLNPNAAPSPAFTFINGAITPVVPFTSADQLKTALYDEFVRWQQAQHNPFAPTTPEPYTEKSSKREFGPLKFEDSVIRGELPAAPGIRVTKPSNFPQIKTDTAPQLPPAQLPTSAPWTLLDEWDGVGGLPLGVTTRGLLLADPETAPHLLIAGTSGSGKTRYGLRPLIAAAIADGWNVSIFDKSGLDFLPFEKQTVVLATALEAIAYLDALYAEIQKRFKFLRAAGASTWARLPDAAPRILAVFDEFSNLADDLDPRNREQLWRHARMIAAEGRKAGVHLMLALQDPSHKSIDLRIRRNCTPMSFRVRDGDSSRVILNANGAETLADRQFLTYLGDLQYGYAFAPSDDDLRQFIGDHATRHTPQEWLSSAAAVINAPIPATAPFITPSAAPLPPMSADIEALVEALRPAFEADPTISKRALARSIGKDYAGHFAARLDTAYAYLVSALHVTH